MDALRTFNNKITINIHLLICGFGLAFHRIQYLKVNDEHCAIPQTENEQQRSKNMENKRVENGRFHVSSARIFVYVLLPEPCLH